MPAKKIIVFRFLAEVKFYAVFIAKQFIKAPSEQGIVFAEFDGHVVEYDLKAGQRIL